MRLVFYTVTLVIGLPVTNANPNYTARLDVFDGACNECFSRISE